MADEPLTFDQAVAGVSEFIEVAIHTILHVRQVYPPDLFIRRKKYDTPVFQSRHPTLNEYISGAIKAVSDEMAQGTVEKVVMVIRNKEHVALERFIFSVENMVEVEPFNRGTRIENAMTAKSLVQYFRSFLIKLSMLECQLGQMNLGDDISFAILLELKDKAAPSVSHTTDPPPWVPAETQHTTAGVTEEAELHMIRSVNTGVINVSIAVQESAEKLRLEKEKRKQRRLEAKKAAELLKQEQPPQ